MFSGRRVNPCPMQTGAWMKFTRAISSFMSNLLDTVLLWRKLNEFLEEEESSPSAKWICRSYCPVGLPTRGIHIYLGSSGESRVMFMEERSPNGTNTTRALLKTLSGDFWHVTVSRESKEYQSMIREFGTS